MSITETTAAVEPKLTASGRKSTAGMKKTGAFGSLPTKKIFSVRSSQLRLNPDPFRFWAEGYNWDAVLEFARTIDQKGIIDDPIEIILVDGVTNEAGLPVFTVEDGDSRVLAAAFLEGRNLLTGATVPAMRKTDEIEILAMKVPDGLSNLDRIFRRLHHMNQRSLTDLEWAATVRKLRGEQAIDVKTGQPAVDGKGQPKMLTAVQIAERLGRTEAWVSRMNKLSEASEEVQTLMVRNVFATATFLEYYDAYGLESAEAMMMAAHKKSRADAETELPAARAALDAATAKVAELTAQDEEPVAPHTGTGRRPLSALELAQRDVVKAAEGVKTLELAAERGAPRITRQDVRAQVGAVAAAPKADKTPKTGSTAKGKPRVSAFAFGVLLDACKFSAANSSDPATRELMNKTLTGLGYDAIAAKVGDDGEMLPVEGEVVAEAAAE